MKTLQHRFVDFIPEKLEGGILYISMEYCTAIHLCVCGCGNEVVTPISPTDWKLSFNGESVSLTPSIGNWNFKCKSHYWITNNQIEMAKKWSKKKIDSGRKADEYQKKIYYKKNDK
ncbi:MAG: hypothetical protein KF900_11700 [Bacteroidetes bacterium]|nr:hypothetical protein [Bacteroidota bacterium]